MNYYEIFPLNREWTLEKINKSLNEIYKQCLQRSNLAPNPKARFEAESLLQTIVEAKKVFKNELTRANYDKLLLQSLSNTKHNKNKGIDTGGGKTFFNGDKAPVTTPSNHADRFFENFNNNSSHGIDSVDTGMGSPAQGKFAGKPFIDNIDLTNKKAEFENYYHMALKMYRSSNYTDARHFLNMPLLLKPENEYGCALASKISYATKNYQQALYEGLKASEISYDAEIMYLLGNISEQLKKYEDAAGYYLKSCEKDPGNIEYLFSLGLVYAHINQFRRANEIFEKVLMKSTLSANDKKNKEINSAVVENLFAIKEKLIFENWEKKTSEFDKTVTVVPKTKKDLENARKVLEEMEKLAPQSDYEDRRIKDCKKFKEIITYYSRPHFLGNKLLRGLFFAIFVAFCFAYCIQYTFYLNPVQNIIRTHLQDYFAIIKFIVVNKKEILLTCVVFFFIGTLYHISWRMHTFQQFTKDFVKQKGFILELLTFPYVILRNFVYKFF